MAAGGHPSHSAGSQTGARGGGARWQDSKPQAGWHRTWEAGQATLTHFLSTAAEKQTLPWRGSPGAPLHTRSSPSCRDRHAHADRALEGSRPRQQEEERASPQSPTQGDLPGAPGARRRCWGRTAGLAARRPLHWAPSRPPAAPRQQLLLQGFPLDTTSGRTHLRRTHAFHRTKASRGLPPDSTGTPGGLVSSQQP